jgi:DNA-binding transcriptional LysR family regulator
MWTAPGLTTCARRVESKRRGAWQSGSFVINIPIELLRTLVAVADFKSFTRAGQTLGLTQPAVSAQIKRLQVLLTTELFDKSSAGVVLTREGNAVVTYARRLLSINDQILQVTAPAPSARTLRVGVSGDYISTFLPRAFAKFGRNSPYRKFLVTGTMNNEKLLHDLRTGELDVVVVWSGDKPEIDARHHWTEDMVWGRSPSLVLDPAQPVPLVSRGDEWLNHRLAVSVLERAGRSYEVVLIGPTILALITAVREGLGVMPFGRRRILNTDLQICDEIELPKLPALSCSIYVSDAGDPELLHALADAIADVIRPPRRPLPAHIDLADRALLSNLLDPPDSLPP